MKQFFSNLWNKLFGPKTKKVPEVVPVPIPTQPVDTPPQTEGSGFVLGKVEGAINNELSVIKDAITLVSNVVTSPKFKELVLAETFTNTGGLTNQEIYEKFTQNKITVNVSMFTGSWIQNHVYGTMGYDVEGDDFVHANRYFVKTAPVLGSLILHEIAHTLGFHHVSAKESSSVPYRMNKIFDEINKTII